MVATNQAMQWCGLLHVDKLDMISHAFEHAWPCEATTHVHAKVSRFLHNQNAQKQCYHVLHPTTIVYTCVAQATDVDQTLTHDKPDPNHGLACKGSQHHSPGPLPANVPSQDLHLLAPEPHVTRTWAPQTTLPVFPQEPTLQTSDPQLATSPASAYLPSALAPMLLGDSPIWLHLRGSICGRNQNKDVSGAL